MRLLSALGLGRPKGRRRYPWLRPNRREARQWRDCSGMIDSCSPMPSPQMAALTRPVQKCSRKTRGAKAAETTVSPTRTAKRSGRRGVLKAKEPAPLILIPEPTIKKASAGCRSWLCLAVPPVSLASGPLHPAEHRQERVDLFFRAQVSMTVGRSSVARRRASCIRPNVRLHWSLKKQRSRLKLTGSRLQLTGW